MMNDRILELANKANEDVGFTFKMEDAKKIHELMEKFAELIVRECVGRVRYCVQNDLDYIAEDIEQHFGVDTNS
jgi:hypothetical protein